MSGHTPGPWRYWPKSAFENGVVSTEAGQHVAQPNRSEDGPLLAAAPDLLEALEKMVRVHLSQPSKCEAGPECYDCNEAPLCELEIEAHAAIAKAKGES